MINIAQLSSKDKALLANKILEDPETTLTIIIAASRLLKNCDEKEWQVVLKASSEADEVLENCGHENCVCEELSEVQHGYFQWIGALREVDTLSRGK